MRKVLLAATIGLLLSLPAGCPLLPPAEPDNLDHPDTRDGVLRTALRDEEDVFARGYVAVNWLCFWLYWL